MSMTHQCTCGRPLNAGRSAGTSGNTRCLICQTNEIMRTCPYPVAAERKAKREKGNGR
jgi:hypothetical protein